MLFPMGFSTRAYETVFRYPLIWIFYYNTVFYTVVGTTVSVVLTVLAAYPLAKKRMVFRVFFLFLITFTMFFSGGLIPTYLVVMKLGMIDTRWAMIVPLSVGAWNVIMWNNFFQPFIYLNDNELYPLPLILRQIVINNDVERLIELGAMNPALTIHTTT